MPQLPADCLNEIFEYLEADKVTLRSCLLVNRLWCAVSVRILWRSIRNYHTLIACLPDESKEILSKNGIVCSTLASKPPMFNYASYCKVLSVSHHAYNEIVQPLENQQSVLSQNLKNIIIQEIFKLLMNKISSLKKLVFCWSSLNNIPKFTSFPGANDCLKDLSELQCYSENDPELLYQLSQICRNLQSLRIEFTKVISNGLADLVSVQRNLKHLDLSHWYVCEGLTSDIITS